MTGRSALLTSVDTASSQCDTAAVTTSQATSPTQGVQGVACPDTSFFSFDIFRNGLWSRGTQPGEGQGTIDPHPGWLTLDGVFHDDCFSTRAAQIAAGVVGGNGFVYVLWEDDMTVVKMNADTCQFVGGFQIPNPSGSPVGSDENTNEEEQIACDPLSFATPVIWVRNSKFKPVSAYPVPDAYCPFPTRLDYSGPATVAPGGSMTVCFTLSGALAGSWQPLSGLPITVRVGGTPAGQPLTDQSGRACLSTSAPPSFGASMVLGEFGGSNAYLPSSAQGIVVVPGAPRAGVGDAGSPDLPSRGAGLLPLGSQSPPQAGGDAQAATGVDTAVQSQAQSQAQAQSMAQAQPGVMVQRQRQRQVVTQTQAAGINTVLQASALRRDRAAPAGALAVAAAALLGFGLALRRPRTAPARAERRRRA